MARSVNPFEEAYNKANDCEKDGDSKIYYGHLYLTVHSVVKGREGAARN